MPIQTQPRRVFLTSLGFTIAYMVPAVPLISIWVGQIVGHPNVFAALPLAIAYILVPIVEGIWPYGIQPMPTEKWNVTSWQFYYRALLWLSFPIQLGMLCIALHFWSLGLLNAWGSLAYILSVGIFSGMFAITIGHELIHHSQPVDCALGGVLLSTVCFGTFKIVHLRIHHRYVCTPDDFATAKKGQSIYHFWWINRVANITEALRCEREDLAKQGRQFWQSELLLWTVLSLLWFAIAILLGGWWGGLFFGLQSFIAILKLDWTNYLQHYGLTRKRDAKGNYEPVQHHHAWSVGLFIHDLAIFNLLRHGDHHVNPQRPYPFLEHDNRTREYPYNYSVMYLLSLLPGVFENVVHPYLNKPETLAQPLQEAA
ncbi:MAG: fatty acid desaturase [Cyanobacteria bacterium J06639_16]